VPYRNTYEIYQAAYQLIASDPKLQKSMQEEGILVVPDLSSATMRHGPKPLITRYDSIDSELIAIRSKIEEMIANGTDPQKIAVLHRHRRAVMGTLNKEFGNLGVNINTFHAYKGLEFDCVFLCQLQQTLVRGGNEDEVSNERRLMYMAMTRARQNLYMGYESKLPNKFKSMRDFVDMIEY
jgi:superfamily I DNA/RNA helicase